MRYDNRKQNIEVEQFLGRLRWQHGVCIGTRRIIPENSSDGLAFLIRFMVFRCLRPYGAIPDVHPVSHSVWWSSYHGFFLSTSQGTSTHD